MKKTEIVDLQLGASLAPHNHSELAKSANFKDISEMATNLNLDGWKFTEKIYLAIWSTFEPELRTLLEAKDIKNHHVPDWMQLELPIAICMASLADILALALRKPKPSGLAAESKNTKRLEVKTDKKISELRRQIVKLEKIKRDAADFPGLIDLERINLEINLREQSIIDYKNETKRPFFQLEESCAIAIDYLVSTFGKNETSRLIKKGTDFFETQGCQTYNSNFKKFFSADFKYSTRSSKFDWFHDQASFGSNFGFRIYTKNERKKLQSKRLASRRETKVIEGNRNFHRYPDSDQ